MDASHPENDDDYGAELDAMVEETEKKIEQKTEKPESKPKMSFL